MFPTQGLFNELPCPDAASCPNNPCLFSHAPQPVQRPAATAARKPSTSSLPKPKVLPPNGSRPSVPLARPRSMSGGAAERPAATGARSSLVPAKRTAHTQDEDPFSQKMAEAQALKKRALIGSSSPGQPVAGASTSSAGKAPAGGPVVAVSVKKGAGSRSTSGLASSVVAKPKISPVKPSTMYEGGSVASTSTSRTLGSSSLSSTPRVAHTGPTHTKLPVRQQMLETMFRSYLDVYSQLPAVAAQTCAARDATIQEKTVYAASNKITYRNAMITALGRLKKRPKALTEEDTGTLEEVIKRAKDEEAATKGKLTRAKISKFVATPEQLQVYGYVTEVPHRPGGTIPTEVGQVRACDRCGTNFTVLEGNEIDRTVCAFHWGRIRTVKQEGAKERVWTCCMSKDAVPCQTGPHVFRDDDNDALHDREAYVATSSLPAPLPGECLDVCALDCEMVYSTSGMALARLTVIKEDISIALDVHVRPVGDLLDANTRFSGVVSEDLRKAQHDIASVRELLAQFIDADTIIVGHGLENDLKALRLVHLNVIDTAILFPHSRGPPLRLALRVLAQEHLKIFIQDDDPTVGHSPITDAKTALELVRWKVTNGVGS